MFRLSILKVEHLRTYYQVPKGFVKAVDDVSFEINAKECLGLVGESGCGKSTVGLSIIRVLPENCIITGGKILLEEQDILRLSEYDMSKRIRWKKISIIPQNAMSALDPLYRVGDQINEVMLIHENLDSDQATERAKKLLENVGLERGTFNSYPFELSGGMCQRVCIAIALALNPVLLIADEPTTALDVVTQHLIIDFLRKLKKELKLAVLYISHDIGVVNAIADKVAIMYAGKIMEYGNIKGVAHKGYHPYTLGLLNSLPKLHSSKLLSIPGSPPDLVNPLTGCRFHSRCPFSKKICRKTLPDYEEVEKGHYVACHFIDEVDKLREQAKNYEFWERCRDKNE